MKYNTYLSAMILARDAHHDAVIRKDHAANTKQYYAERRTAIRRYRQHIAFRKRLASYIEHLEGEHDAAMAYVDEMDDLLRQHYDNWQREKMRADKLAHELDFFERRI